MLGTHGCVVEPSRNRVGQLDVPVKILEDVAPCALQDADRAAGESSRMPALDDPLAAGFDTDEANPRIVHEPVEDTERVAPAPDAGDHRVRQAANLRLELLPSFPADDRLELPHHQGVGMGTEHRSQQVVGVSDMGHPVAHGFVDGVLERAAARVHRPDGGAEQTHAKQVEGLPLHVLRAHVHIALQVEQRTRGRRRDTVLACPGLGDDPSLAHPYGQQRLAERIVDLVRAGMRQILPFQEDPGAAYGS